MRKDEESGKLFTRLAALFIFAGHPFTTACDALKSRTL